MVCMGCLVWSTFTIYTFLHCLFSNCLRGPALHPSTHKATQSLSRQPKLQRFPCVLLNQSRNLDLEQAETILWILSLNLKKSCIINLTFFINVCNITKILVYDTINPIFFLLINPIYYGGSMSGEKLNL